MWGQFNHISKMDHESCIMDYRVEQTLLGKGYFNPKIISSEEAKIYTKRGVPRKSRYYVVTATIHVALHQFEEQKLFVWCPYSKSGRVIVADKDKNEI